MGDINVDYFFLLFLFAYWVQCWSMCGDMHGCLLVLTGWNVVTIHKAYGNAGLPFDFCLCVAIVDHGCACQDAV